MPAWFADFVMNRVFNVQSGLKSHGLSQIFQDMRVLRVDDGMLSTRYPFSSPAIVSWFVARLGSGKIGTGPE